MVRNPRVDTGRRALGRALPDEIVRERLIDMLAERWNVGVVTVQAPGGYGKSIALAQAIRDNEADPTGIDVYVRCRPQRNALVGLTADIGLALTGRTLVDGAEQTDPKALADLIVEAVASRSPHDVCVCIDDVHALADVDGFDVLLDTLIERLPLNGHVLLAGRLLPALRLARRRAGDDLVEVGSADLAFDEHEVDELARRHDVGADRLANAAGWPAVTRLLVVSGHDSSVEFMMEEVVNMLTSAERLALGTAIVAAPATRELLDALVPGIESDRLVASVPLLVHLDDGAIAAHDIWHEMLDSIIDPDEQRRVADAVIAHCIEVGDMHRAASIALDHGLWEVALDSLMHVLVELDMNVDLAQLDQWLSALPPAACGSPEWKFLTGLRARFNGDVSESTELIREAANTFESDGNLESATTAVLELGLRSWLLNDTSLWDDVMVQGERIIAAGGVRMERSSLMGRVIEAEMSGDLAGALAEYEAASDLDMLGLGHAAMLSMLVGDPDRSISYLERQSALTDRELVAGQIRGVHWEAGRPHYLLADPRYMTPLLDNSRDLVRGLAIESMIEANCGIAPDAERLDAIAWERSREQTFVALASAARDLFEMGEAEASERFESRLSTIGWDDPLLRGELRRYLPYAYVLSERCREWLDVDPTLGPLHVKLRRLANDLLAARRGETIGELAPNESILTWLPLPWSVELAAHLCARDDARGRSLATYLSDVTGSATHRELRRLRSATPGLGKAVDTLLSEIPSPPQRPTRLVVCGTFSLSHGDEPTPVTRIRVRQLLVALTLRTEWSRAALTALLWPGDESKARSNLRTTLRYCRRLLEPSRESGEAPFHVRQRADRIWLQRSEHLDVDVWEIDRLLDHAESLDTVGQVDAAITARIEAVGYWSENAFSDAGDIDLLQEEIRFRRQRVLDAGAWAAERLLAHGDAVGAVRQANDLLVLDAHFTRAHDVALGAHLALGDLDGARRALDRIESSLAELDVAPAAGTAMLIRRFERRQRHRADHLALVDPVVESLTEPAIGNA